MGAMAMINMEMKDWAMLGAFGAFVALSLYPVYGNPEPAIKEPLGRFLTFAMGVASALIASVGLLSTTLRSGLALRGFVSESFLPPPSFIGKTAMIDRRRK